MQTVADSSAGATPTPDPGLQKAQAAAADSDLSIDGFLGCITNEDLPAISAATRFEMVGMFGPAIPQNSNQFNEDCSLDSITNDYFMLHISDSCTLEGVLLPTDKKGKPIMVTSCTVMAGEIPDSELMVYSSEFKRVSANKYFTAPKLEDFFTAPKGEQAKLKEALAQLPFTAFRYDLSAPEKQLKVTLPLKELAGLSLYETLKPYFIDCPITYTFSGSKFIR
jgi:hypothetical protein